RELPEDIKDNDQLKQFAKDSRCFDDDAAIALNEKMPLSVLKEAAASQTLSRRLRREVALAAWVRAALLDDEETALALAPGVSQLEPALKKYIDSYVSAADSASRKFAAIYLILKFPGADPEVGSGVGRLTALGEIDNYRNNWWCALGRPAAPPDG